MLSRWKSSKLAQSAFQNRRLIKEVANIPMYMFLLSIDRLNVELGRVVNHMCGSGNVQGEPSCKFHVGI